MRERFSEPKAPVWRLALYGVVGFGGACWIGTRQGSRGLVIGAAIAIPLLIFCLLGVTRFARSPSALRLLPLIFLVYTIVQSLLIVWDLFLRHK